MQRSRKIVLLGYFGVGKTSLIRRFVKDSFSDNYKVTIGVHITKKVIEVTGKDKVTLILWDLEGSDEIQMIRDSYLLGTHGAVYVFDVSRPSTFQNLDNDLDMVQQKIGEIPLLVVGNKIDLVDLDELQALLNERRMASDFLTSAKTGSDVNEMFTQLATLLNEHS